MLKKEIRIARDIAGNFLAPLFGNELTYLVETDEWSIQEDGKAITYALNDQKLLCARISTTPIGLRNQIVHFGSVNTFFKNGRSKKSCPSNQNVLTWFHVVPNDSRLILIHKAQKELRYIHTSCESTRQTLLHAGVDLNKLVVIPLGIDRKLFTLTNDEKKRTIREQLGIPMNRLVIGSFQKDGMGWGEGMEPKLIKGPDIFVEVVSQLKHLNPFVLLTGPARGYVKRELEDHNIPFKHVYLKHFRDLPRMYHALDLYLITSRIEGGPKALLEAWASGVPVVSTNVGMVPDIAVHNQTVLMTESERIDNLVKQSERFLTDRSLCQTISQNALKDVQRYDWNLIARQYFENLYRPLL